MSFYNDYRPHRFSDLLGQEQIIRMLKNQSKADKLAHAYFCYGPSGTGKTTVSRLIAMSANCLELKPDGEPCGVCDNCRLTIEGKHWDCCEYDSARFRGIDDIKELCYKAYFAPLGKKRIFILDECHQITEAGFNALLKLIEEPPPYLLIVLVTTDFSKIPETVKSRCQLLHFNSLTTDQVKTKLQRISHSEGIPLNETHANFIAQSSGGNCRTAENILEQTSFVHA
jgi:DNA polymerase III subunit gamma/tau